MTQNMTANDFVSAPCRESSNLGEPVSVLCVCVDDQTWRFLNLFAESTGLIVLRGRVGEYRASKDEDAFLHLLGNVAPDICLLDFDKNRQSAAVVAEGIHGGTPDTAIFAISSQTHPEAILEAMRAGCGEYLTKPLERDQLLKAIARIGSRRRDKERQEQGRAQLLAFMGSKGGCGTTTGGADATGIGRGRPAGRAARLIPAGRGGAAAATAVGAGGAAATACAA